MSVPMEEEEQQQQQEQIALQNPQSHGNGIVPPPSPSPMLSDEKVLLPVEVCLNPSSTAPIHDVRSAVERMLEQRNMSYCDGPIPLPPDETFLTDNVQRICVCDTDKGMHNDNVLLFWQVKPVVHVYQPSEGGPCEEISSDGQCSSFNEWILPAKEFDGIWGRPWLLQFNI